MEIHFHTGYDYLCGKMYSINKYNDKEYKTLSQE